MQLLKKPRQKQDLGNPARKHKGARGDEALVAEASQFCKIYKCYIV